MMRWMLKLACGHHVLSDERMTESEWCPGCNYTFLVLDCEPYLDEEAS